MLTWADVIFVMEKKHLQRIEEKFPEAIANKKIYIFDIPDEYQYMDSELIESIQLSVSGYLSQ